MRKMKYAVLGDIHSNYEAFKAVLKVAKAEGVQKIICTGDLIGYGADPVKCVKLMRSLPLEVYVGGNHEEKLLCTDGASMNHIARVAISYTRDQLSSEDIDWIYNTANWSHDFGNGVAVAHGSLWSPTHFDYLSIDEYARRRCHKTMKEAGVNLLFVGHTHSPSLMPKDKKGYPVYTGVDFIKTDEVSPCIIDVGSVGQPRDGDYRASFAIYDSDDNIVIRHRVEYDVKKASAKILQAGLPEKLALRILDGK